MPHESQRRRTFAIISHPDAGKTTLTEKLLLYGGAIHQAGAVKSRKAQRAATSDWMEIEKKRGISVTSSAMAFEFGGYPLQPARHAGPPGLQRGHLPHADRGRLRDHADRRGQGRRGADAQAVRGVPHARHADRHLRQQARPPGARSDGADDRGRRGAQAAHRAGHLADRQRRPLPGRVRPACTSEVLRFERTAAATRPRRRSTVERHRRPGARSRCSARTRCATLRDEIELLDGAGEQYDAGRVPARRDHAGVLRQRAHELRRRAVPATRSRRCVRSPGRTRAPAT